MQVTEVQVQRSLEALTAEPDDAVIEGPDASPAGMPEGLVQQLVDGPAIRSDRLEEAKRRLETGEQPSAEDLAQRMVGRLVCDRLR